MKKLIAFALAVVMLFSLLPAMAFAAEAENYDFAALVQKTEPGQIVKLTQNVQAENPIVINKAITVDLGGRTYTLAKEAEAAFIIDVADDETVVFKNGTVSVADIETEDGKTVKAGAAIAVKSGKLSIASGSYLGEIKVYDDASASITGGTFINDVSEWVVEAGYRCFPYSETADKYQVADYTKVYKTLQTELAITPPHDYNSSDGTYNMYYKITDNDGNFVAYACYTQQLTEQITSSTGETVTSLVYITSEGGKAYTAQNADGSLNTPAFAENAVAPLSEAYIRSLQMVSDSLEDENTTYVDFLATCLAAQSSLHFVKCQDAAAEAIAEIDAAVVANNADTALNIITKKTVDQVKRKIQLIPEIYTIYYLKDQALGDISSSAMKENVAMTAITLGIDILSQTLLSSSSKNDTLTLVTEIIGVSFTLISFLQILKS